MSDTIITNKGQCLRFDGTWPDEDGLAGKTIAVVDAYPAALTGLVVTITDEAAGTFSGFADAGISAALRSGRVNWIRLGLSSGGTCVDTTPQIWINVV